MILRLMILASLLFSALSFSTISNAGLFERHTAIPVSEAIQFETSQQDQNLLVHFTLADGVYLYKDRVKLKLDDGSNYSHISFIEQADTINDPSFGEVDVFFNSATVAINRSLLPADTQSIQLKYQGCDKVMGLCYPPQKVDLDITTLSTSNTAEKNTTTESNLDNANSIQQFLQSAGMLVIVATFLLLGIGLTFTPCVLPMIPILSSVIAGQDNLTPKKGFVMSTTYVLGMALTFALAGTVVGLMGARFNIQIYMQQPEVLGVFAALFVLLAMSMFGFYELRLPRFIQDPLDRLNQKQDGGSLISVFLMGALSAVVVSPCVSAPLAGALVYISTTGDALLGGLALFALGLGMGLPLIAIGTTGASVMPKAGGWMDQVKNFFGVLLLAVALWVLGRVLPEAIYLAGWVLLIGVYAVMLGAFESAQSGKQRFMKGLALIAFIFAMMLMFKLIMGEQTANTSYAVNNNNSAQQSTASHDSIFQTISTEDELQKILTTAKSEEQIVMVDVYADWCIECKIMAKGLFADGDVKNQLEGIKSVKLDITEFNDFHKTYLEQQGVFGPPALLFYGLDGNAIKDAQVLGEIHKEAFLQHLEQFDY